MNEGTDRGVALVTGAARRIGAEIVRTLHAAGYRVGIHYRSAAAEARELAIGLDPGGAGSAASFQADLLAPGAAPALIEAALARFGRLDLLVNNASTFYPTPIGAIDDAAWADLVGTNLRAPLFLAQAAAPALRSARGSIVNVTDVYAERPLAGHAVYCAAKSGLLMLTRVLARDLAPEVRVNAVAPGPILWPDPPPDEARQRAIIDATPLARLGSPREIAGAVLFLARDAAYTTGAVLPVDGGTGLGH